MRFLIVDGYPEASRDELCCAGVTAAHRLFAEMLQDALPGAESQVLYPSDPQVRLPEEAELKNFRGVLWTGCNLTIHDASDARVPAHLELARRSFRAGVPAFGSCWAIQVAAVVAGGEVRANPRGREIGVSRKIQLTAEGREHPMYTGKPVAFDGFTSHLDEVSRLPPGARLLAGNRLTPVQAMAVEYEGGTFWATQYHTEFTLADMARLMVARRQALCQEGFFAAEEDVLDHARSMEALGQEPERKDLGWALGLDQDVCDPTVRRLEFTNWLRYELKLDAGQPALC